jgi:DNA-binding transcriptional ArsR family regulator
MPTIKRKPTVRDDHPDDFAVSGPEQLHALANSTRWRILGRLLDGPASIQELARSLGAAKGTIGHHVHVLEKAGLIRLVERTRVRGVVEKRYGRVGRRFRLPEWDEVPAESRHEVAVMPLRQAIEEARPASGQDDPSMSLLIRARMPAERARRFAAMVEVLASEFSEGAPGSGETYGLVAGIYRPNWSDPDDEGEA